MDRRSLQTVRRQCFRAATTPSARGEFGGCFSILSMLEIMCFTFGTTSQGWPDPSCRHCRNFWNDPAPGPATFQTNSLQGPSQGQLLVRALYPRRADQHGLHAGVDHKPGHLWKPRSTGPGSMSGTHCIARTRPARPDAPLCA